MCVCACVRACVRACASVCVRMCVCESACARARVRVRACMRACVRACVHACMCVCARARTRSVYCVVSGYIRHLPLLVLELSLIQTCTNHLTRGITERCGSVTLNVQSGEEQKRRWPPLLCVTVSVPKGARIPSMSASEALCCVAACNYVSSLEAGKVVRFCANEAYKVSVFVLTRRTKFLFLC